VCPCAPVAAIVRVAGGLGGPIPQPAAGRTDGPPDPQPLMERPAGTPCSAGACRTRLADLLLRSQLLHGACVVFAAWFRRPVLLRGRLRPPALCLERSSTSPTHLPRPRHSPPTARGRAAPLRADRRKRFRSMSRHDAEPGCGVLTAVESGALPERRLASYRKLLSRPDLGHGQPGRRRAQGRRPGRRSTSAAGI
jgi:hypothetical protein